MREVENLPFGPTARWTSLNLVGSFDRPPGCRTWLGAPVSSERESSSELGIVLFTATRSTCHRASQLYGDRQPSDTLRESILASCRGEPSTCT